MNKIIVFSTIVLPLIVQNTYCDTIAQNGKPIEIVYTVEMLDLKSVALIIADVSERWGMVKINTVKSNIFMKYQNVSGQENHNNIQYVEIASDSNYVTIRVHDYMVGKSKWFDGIAAMIEYEFIKAKIKNKDSLGINPTTGSS